MSMNGALVRHTYPDAMLGRGIGLNGLVVSIAAAVAPSLAAGILAVGPWPWLFAVNVPFGLLNLWLALRYLPRSETSRRPFDWTSALLSAAMFGLFFVGADGLARGGGGLAGGRRARRRRGGRRGARPAQHAGRPRRSSRSTSCATRSSRCR